METIRVISRDSRLAIVQVQEVISKIKGVRFEIHTTKSYGDKHLEIPLSDDIPSDFFTRELDEALLNNEADIAVHSAKDLPYPLPEGLEVVALTECLSNSDALVSRNKEKLSQLRQNALVGCSSRTRKEQLLKLRPDLQIVDIRGTIDQRLQKVFNNELDAIIVAECAMKRLELDEFISEILPIETHPLQGYLAVVAKRGNAFLKSLFYEIDVRKNFGKVWLVGFGPGNPELLTIKALKAIHEADVIYYDDLLDQQFLEVIVADKIYVGKRRGYKAFGQDEINQMMYKSALNGKNVVRLKGGDPFIFGRGGEEYDYLASRLIRVEVVPGITSALAAAASAAAPLTLREKARSVSFCAASDVHNIPVPNSDTLVYYMGAENAAQLANEVIKQGKKPDTPVIIVESAGADSEYRKFTRLSELANGTVKTHSPAIIIIGEHLKNNIYTDKPDNQVLVTSTDTKKYEHLGKIVHSPIIAVEEITDNPEINQMIENASKYNWIVFTSRWAVHYFLKALINLKKDIRHFSNAQIIAIGKATADELLKYYINADLVSTNESSSGIVDLFMERQLPGKNVLIPRSNIAADTMPSLLRKMGYIVDTVSVYRNVFPESYQPVDLTNIDIVVFGSPSGVRNFKKVYQKIPSHIQVITKGDVTRNALYTYGLLPYEDWVI